MPTLFVSCPPAPFACSFTLLTREVPTFYRDQSRVWWMDHWAGAGPAWRPESARRGGLYAGVVVIGQTAEGAWIQHQDGPSAHHVRLKADIRKN